MSFPQKSINVHVPWGQCLKALGIAVQSQVLPQQIKCPLCRSKRMTIYQDNTCGGSWHYCWSCKTAGDMIQLASKAWKIGIQSTVIKLHKLGCPIPQEKLLAEAIDGYVKRHIDGRKKLADFWEESRKDLYQNHDADLQTLRYKLGIRCDISRERWIDGPSHLLGSSDKGTVEVLFAPNAAWLGGRTQGRIPINPSATRIFRGRRWNKVLVMPFYDLPGRISGFMFMGRDGKPEDFAWKRPNVSPKHKEIGLGMMTTVWEGEQKYGNIVFALQDPLVALQLQMKQFRENGRPLPIVTWMNTATQRTNHAWHSLHDKKIVFWAPSLDANTVTKAIQTDSWISTAGPANQTLRKYIDHTFHDGLTRRITKAAKRWSGAVAKSLEKMENHEIEDLFLQLHLTEPQIDRVLDNCNQDTAERTRLLLNESVRQRAVIMKGKEVIEKDTGWWTCIHGKEELISDAILKIEQVIYQPRSGKTYYRGNIFYYGDLVPFCALKETVETETGKWMQKQLLVARKGLMRFRSSWGRDLVELAQDFHKPEFLEGDTMIGWDEENQCLVLPGRKFYLGGKTEETNRDLFPADTPGWSLDFEPYTREEAKWITHHSFELSSQFWAAVVSVLANLLSRVVGRGRAGIALTGDTKLFYTSLAHLGCQPAEIVQRENLPVKREFDEHDWPAPITPHYTVEAPLRQWLSEKRESPNVVLTLHEISGFVLAINGGWNIIHVPTGANQARFDHPAVYKLIPSLLKFVLQKSEKLIEDCQTFQLEHLLLTQIQDFLQVMKGNPAPVLGANNCWQWPYDKDNNPDAFADLTSALVANGNISIIEDGFEGKTKKMVMVRNSKDNTLFLPLQAMETFLKKRKAPKLDFEAVLEGLSAADRFKGSYTLKTREGWLLDLAWFEHHYQQYTEARKTNLKVVG